MAGEQTLEGGDESGGALRQKLEEALEANKALRTGLVSSVTGRFEGVTAADLEGTAPDQLEAKAAEIQAQKAAEQQQAAQTFLRNAGWTDEQIAQVGAGETSAPTPPSTQTTEVLGQLGGQPPSREPDTAGMTPDQKIAFGIAARQKK